MGGENWLAGEEWALEAGSSPRGRGKLDKPLDEILTSGLIPAWAGKTESNWRAVTHSRAHPRVGGENAFNIDRQAIR